jgi:hypothetical protein
MKANKEAWPFFGNILVPKCGIRQKCFFRKNSNGYIF